MTQQSQYVPGNGSGKVSPQLSESIRKKVLGDVDTMREGFKKLDIDNSGTVERAEMERMLCMYNIACNDNDFEEFFKKYDINGDGKFSYGEFVKLIQGT